MTSFPAVRNAHSCFCMARVEMSAISSRSDENSIQTLRSLARAAKFWKMECRGSFDDWPKACSTWKT